MMSDNKIGTIDIEKLVGGYRINQSITTANKPAMVVRSEDDDLIAVFEHPDNCVDHAYAFVKLRSILQGVKEMEETVSLIECAITEGGCEPNELEEACGVLVDQFQSVMEAVE